LRKWGNGFHKEKIQVPQQSNMTQQREDEKLLGGCSKKKTNWVDSNRKQIKGKKVIHKRVVRALNPKERRGGSKRATEESQNVRGGGEKGHGNRAKKWKSQSARKEKNPPGLCLNREGGEEQPTRSESFRPDPERRGQNKEQRAPKHGSERRKFTFHRRAWRGGNSTHLKGEGPEKKT